MGKMKASQARPPSSSTRNQSDAAALMTYSQGRKVKTQRSELVWLHPVSSFCFCPGIQSRMKLVKCNGRNNAPSLLSRCSQYSSYLYKTKCRNATTVEPRRGRSETTIIPLCFNKNNRLWACCIMRRFKLLHVSPAGSDSYSAEQCKYWGVKDMHMHRPT